MKPRSGETLISSTSERRRKSARLGLFVAAAALVIGVVGVGMQARKRTENTKLEPTATAATPTTTPPAGAFAEPSTGNAPPPTDPSRTSNTALASASTSASTSPLTSRTPSREAPSTPLTTAATAGTAKTNDPTSKKDPDVPPASASTGATAPSSLVKSQAEPNVVPPPPPPPPPPSATAPPGVPTTAASPSAPASTVAPSPSFDARHARAVMGAVQGEHGVRKRDVQASVARAIPAITQCYQSELARIGRGEGGQGSIRVETDGSGRIVKATAQVPFSAAVARCVERSVLGSIIAGVDTGEAVASISISFEP